ncbi:MAG: sigma-70 family RNA polymerase sigma factor [Acidobacteriia bacterium]|nr:sigma-70 family RNA polymerase sigma factor [Terriglobia bacterium]MBV9746857.1 sigma-70 family RNA polymerase sigma factor [Terriglobia bacterium]
MSVYSLGKEITGAVASGSTEDASTAKLREQVTRLFEEARGDVYRYLLTIGLHPPQAQEATQEVFLRLYATLRKGETIRNPRGWIFRVAHNHGLKVRARQDSELPFDPELEIAPVAQTSNPEKELAERQRMARFHRAIENLSEQQRRCLFLRMEGLRYPEIGAALGISVSAVGEFLRRAIERLRRLNDV